MPSGQEIQSALRRFVARWRDYTGGERGGAQTFLNELFDCYGTDRHASGARFEDSQSSAGIMDLYWAVGNCIIEMKAPSRASKLAEHRDQALAYWRESSYLIGDDIADRPDQTPSRWVVDFELRSLEEAKLYPAALEIVRREVKPNRDDNRRQHYRKVWWQFGEPRRAMRAALAGLPRYVAAGATNKRPFGQRT
jgi:hypothetical protein